MILDIHGEPPHEKIQAPQKNSQAGNFSAEPLFEYK
jgi:hypothetical protein